MDCISCGHSLGVSGWFSSRMICQSCEANGQLMLRQIVSKIRPGADFDQALGEFEATVAKYHLDSESTQRMKNAAIENLMRAVLAADKVSNDDLLRIVDVIKKHPMKAGGDLTVLQGLADAVNKRVVIDNWDPKDPPAVEACSGLFLQPGEMCHWEEIARIMEQRVHREYAGVSQGVSVPLGHGLRYRVGAFKGAPIDKAYMADCGPGRLHITSQRVCFAGEQQSAAIEWKKIINVSGFSEGFSIQTGAKKPVIIQVMDPELTVQILSLAAPSQNAISAPHLDVHLDLGAIG